MIVGEGEIEVTADTSKVDDDMGEKLNRIAARAGDRFGTILGRAIGAPFRLFTQRAATDATGGLNAVASRAGERFGTAIGRAAGGPLRRLLDAAGSDAGRSAGGSFTRAFRTVLGGLAVVGLFHAVTSQFRAGLAEFSAGETGRAQLDAAITSTGRAAGLTTPQLLALADSIQRTTGADDDAVVSAEALLLSFTKVRDVAGQGSNVFTRAVRDARDLSVRGFGDLKTTTEELGKALNNPIQGITALTSAGVQFTAGQRRQILTLIEQNDVLGAQKLILAQVETQVGGAATAYGHTLPGALSITRERFNNLRGEIIGRLVPSILSGLGVTNRLMDDVEAHPEKIDRVIRRVTTFIRDFALGVRDAFNNVIDAFQRNEDHINRLRGVFGLLSETTGTGSLLQSSLGLVGDALGLVVTGVLTLADAFFTLTAAIGTNLGEALRFVADFVRGIDAGFGRILDAAGGVLTMFGGPAAGLALKAARAQFDSGLGDIADDIDRFADTIYLGGQRIGSALAGGIGQGLLSQAKNDPALGAALQTILGAPEGIGISPRELDKYADGVKLRDSFLAGLSGSGSATAPDATGMIDDFDKRLAEAQKNAADRARAAGDAVTRGMRDQVERVKKEVASLTTQRTKILDFRSSVLGATASFTALSGLIDDPSTSTAARISRALSNRLLGLQTFARNLQTLARRGLDKGVIAELALGGPDQRALSSALVQGTDAQIRAVNATESAVRAQQQLVAKVATDAQFGPHALDKANRELAALNAKLATLNKQVQAQPALIAKAVEAARKNAKVSTTTSTRTAVAK